MENNIRPKRVVAIHDLSSYGRCSLGVIAPILSVMGVQCCSVPTALLSTHTGGFYNMYIHNSDDFAPACLKHWNDLNVDAECVYSGFLGNAKQIDDVMLFLNRFNNSLKVVDPVLGDQGEPYQTITEELIKKMKMLVSKADIITPNATEVSLLLDEKYCDTPLSEEAVFDKCERLASLGPKQVIITGQQVFGSGICNLCYNKSTGKLIKVKCDYIPAHYPGTGDIFTSVLVGALMQDRKAEYALSAATSFTEKCIKLTVNSGEPPRDGVFLEYALPFLLNYNIINRAETVERR